MNVSPTYRSRLQVATLLVLATLLTACGINNIPTLDEQAKAAWGQVQNQYQRRADMMPQLAKIVKSYTKHERETFEQVTKARNAATQIHLDAADLTPEKIKAFEQAQNQVTQALSRLIAVSERYPDLKASENYKSLMVQEEGTENRISVARRDFITSVERYNREIRTFPGRIWHSVLYSDLPLRETFEATAPAADKAPEVKF